MQLFYFGWLPGAIFGFGSGILLDVYSSTSYYNVVALTVCGFVCGALMDRLFNRNIAAACVLNLAVAFAYFFCKMDAALCICRSGTGIYTYELYSAVRGVYRCLRHRDVLYSCADIRQTA